MLPARDREGYLQDLEDWNEAVAVALAREVGIELTTEHWDLVHMIRRFYQCYEVAPAMRVLVKHTRDQFGEERGNSLYLMKLFPGSPAKLLAKIAGLPRPTNCL